MPKGAIDDQLAFHRKILAAGNEAVGAWVRMISLSNAQLSDGMVTEEQAATITSTKCVERLLRAGLMHRVEGGLAVHDFKDWNLSREQVLAQREAERVRKAAGRAKQGRDTSGRVTAGSPGGVPPGQGQASHRSSSSSSSSSSSKRAEEEAPPVLAGWDERRPDPLEAVIADLPPLARFPAPALAMAIRTAALGAGGKDATIVEAVRLAAVEFAASCSDGDKPATYFVKIVRRLFSPSELRKAREAVEVDAEGFAPIAQRTADAEARRKIEQEAEEERFAANLEAQRAKARAR